MNVDMIRDLAEMMKTFGLTTLEWEDGSGKLRLGRAAAAEAPAPKADQAQPAPPIQARPEKDDPGMDYSDVTAVAAPMVGVFYASPAPGQPPFVKVGSRVKKGDVLCVLEAMKMMNELIAERDGQVVDICAADGDVVEFGQTLFKLY